VREVKDVSLLLRVEADVSKVVVFALLYSFAC